MDKNVLLGLGALFIALASGMVFVFYYLTGRSQSSIRSLMGKADGSGLGVAGQIRQRLQEDETGAEYEKLKKATKRRFKGKVKHTLQEKFFHAGIFSDRDKREFMRLRLLLPFFTTAIFAFGFKSFNTNMIIIGVVMGLLVGLQAPFSLLDRRIARRSEEILYYLPLVIEQVAIGVSSSLDIGPCLQRVVAMADERDSHNVVTELLRHAQFHVKSGVSLEDALNEVGKLSGQNELKHSFMALSQVAKHGGEITRQLQELADAVSQQREVKIEAKIKKLELEATGPVALVFAGFLIMLLIGFGIQIQGAFK